MAETTSEPPRKVALFSGHMIDAPGRKTPRFPSDKEPIAYHAIASALADLDVEPAAGGPTECGTNCGGSKGVAYTKGIKLLRYF
jgi:hypothetical protein